MTWRADGSSAIYRPFQADSTEVMTETPQRVLGKTVVSESTGFCMLVMWICCFFSLIFPIDEIHR